MLKNKIIPNLLVLLTLLAFISFIVLRQVADMRISAFYEYRKLILLGFLRTILISLIALVGSLVFGFLFYLLQISKYKYLVSLTKVLEEIIYGTPLLVLIVISAFVIGPAFGTYNRAVLGVIALIFYMTPYMKNVFKAGIISINEEQYLAMDVLGFKTFDKYRYLIIPQVIRVLMPPMMNNFSLIIKGSALLSILAYAELFYAIEIAQTKTFAFAGGYLLMWFFYLIITIPLSALSKFIERKWSI